MKLKMLVTLAESLCSSPLWHQAEPGGDMTLSAMLSMADSWPGQPLVGSLVLRVVSVRNEKWREVGKKGTQGDLDLQAETCYF